MVERQIRYSVMFVPCEKCNKQPLLFQSMGSTQKMIVGTEGKYYHLECPRCQVKTARMRTINDVVIAWENMNKVIAEAA